VLLGSLLELLVVRGGIQGTLEAVTIVDDCHNKCTPAWDFRSNVWLMHTMAEVLRWGAIGDVAFTRH
jgi:hypothetical protein